MSLIAETAPDDTFICEVAIREEPTHDELDRKGDVRVVVVSTDTVDRIKRAKELVDRPQLRRRFGGENLSPADKALIAEYKVAVLRLAFEDAGEGVEFACEMAKFAVFRWGLSGGDIDWLTQYAERNSVGSRAMIVRWATRAGRSREARRNNAYRHY